MRHSSKEILFSAKRIKPERYITTLQPKNTNRTTLKVLATPQSQLAKIRMGVGRRTAKTECTEHPRREYFYSHLTTKIRMIITTDEGTAHNRMSFPWIRG